MTAFCQAPEVNACDGKLSMKPMLLDILYRDGRDILSS